MAEFVGGEPISVGVDEPITFENKTYTAFDVACGIVFRKSGLYRVSIAGRRISVAVEPERKKGKWKRIPHDGIYCTTCKKGWSFVLGAPGDIENYHYCPNCGARMEEGE